MKKLMTLVVLALSFSSFSFANDPAATSAADHMEKAAEHSAKAGEHLQEAAKHKSAAAKKMKKHIKGADKAEDVKK